MIIVESNEIDADINNTPENQNGYYQILVGWDSSTVLKKKKSLPRISKSAMGHHVSWRHTNLLLDLLNLVCLFVYITYTV